MSFQNILQNTKYILKNFELYLHMQWLYSMQIQVFFFFFFFFLYNQLEGE